MKRNSLIFLIISLALSSVGLIALTRPGFFLTDDGNSMIIRFSAFYEVLRHGQFPVRFLTRLNFGYGYPVADFLYPLFMYLGVPIHVLGFSFVNTIKIILGLSFLSGTIFSYLWFKKLFDDKSALVGSIAYSLFPYHLFDIYVRGSVGEVLALGIIPFVLWSIEKGNFILISIGYFLLITAHNSLALIFIPVIFVYHLLKQKPLKVLYAFLLGIGLSSFFILPALYEKQFTIFDSIKVSDYGRYFIQSESIILIGLISTVSLIFSLVFLQKKNKKFLLFFITTLLSIFLSTSFSESIWKAISFGSLIQFPFRFLSLTALGVSFLLAYEVFSYQGKIKPFFIIFLLSVIFVTARGFFMPEKFQNYPDTFYSTNIDSTTVKNEYMPRWVKQIPSKSFSSKVDNLNGQEKINLRELSPNLIKFDTYLSSERKIRINTVYFPGWVAYVNGKKSNIIYDDGLINLKLMRGENNVLIKFDETNFRIFADLISLVSISLLLGFIIKRHVKFS